MKKVIYLLLSIIIYQVCISQDITNISGKWTGFTNGNAYSEATFEFQFTNNVIRGTYLGISKQSGVRKTQFTGYFDKNSKSFILKDDNLLTNNPNSNWKFCLIDEYKLKLNSDGISLEGTYYSRACNDNARISLKKDVKHEDLNDGLVAWYPFNGNANDESGNGNDGTVYGAKLCEDRFGNHQSAYYFNGRDSYIDCGTKPELLPENFSYSIWINPISFTDNFARIIQKANPELTDGFSIEFDSKFDNQLFADRKSDDKTIYAAIFKNKKKFPDNKINIDFQTFPYNNDIPLYKWYYIVFLYNNIQKECRFYINGNLIKKSIIQLKRQNALYSNLVIGGYYDYRPNEGALITNYFNGIIDDIRIYDRALSDEEIKMLYEEGNENKNKIVLPTIWSEPIYKSEFENNNLSTSDKKDIPQKCFDEITSLIPRILNVAKEGYDDYMNRPVIFSKNVREYISTKLISFLRDYSEASNAELTGDYAKVLDFDKKLLYYWILDPETLLGEKSTCDQRFLEGINLLLLATPIKGGTVTTRVSGKLTVIEAERYTGRQVTVRVMEKGVVVAETNMAEKTLFENTMEALLNKKNTIQLKTVIREYTKVYIFNRDIISITQTEFSHFQVYDIKGKINVLRTFKEDIKELFTKKGFMKNFGENEITNFLQDNYESVQWGHGKVDGVNTIFACVNLKDGHKFYFMKLENDLWLYITKE